MSPVAAFALGTVLGAALVIGAFLAFVQAIDGADDE